MLSTGINAVVTVLSDNCGRRLLQSEQQVGAVCSGFGAKVLMHVG